MKFDKFVLVTGGAGFIGSHLVDYLIDQNHKVLVLDNLSTGSKNNLPLDHEGLIFIEEDIIHYDKILPYFENVDYVYHLATASVRESLLNPTKVHDVNTTGTLNTLKAASKHKVSKFLYCSSSEVNGTATTVPMPEKYDYNPETIYGASKLLGEYYTQVFQKSGWLNTIIARPHNNYGPREHYEGIKGEVIPRFIIQALNNIDFTIYGDGTQTRDFTFVKDTVFFLDRLMNLPNDYSGEVFNICTNTETSIKDLAQYITSLIGSKSQIVFQDHRPTDVLRLCGDNTKLFDTFNIKPRTKLEDGLKETINWLKALNVDPLSIQNNQFWKTFKREDFIHDSHI